MLAYLDFRLLRHPARPVLTFLAATLALTSCVSGEETEDSGSTQGGDTAESEHATESDGDGPLATSLSTSTIYGSDLRIDVNALERIGNERIKLELTASNTGDSNALLTYTLASPGGLMTRPDGVSLVDTVNNKRHMPLEKPDSEICHCSSWEGNESLSPGSSIDIWATFPAPPEDVTEMTVATPATPDFLDIPLSEAKESDEQLAEAPTKDPVILDISSIQDSLDGETSREEGDGETNIMLSSDVLFDTNESELTSKADGVLERVAGEIDESSDTEIQIDGHTDNTGNDAINDPLSRERADSVKERLKELVNREGITYDTTGHGSNDPVADNGTAEGRKKNRRVTVTFEQ